MLSTRPQPAASFWSRFAAFLSFVAVLSALLAPLSMLAQDVRTGKLGGVCSVDLATTDVSTVGDTGAPLDADGTAPQGAHCDLCASLFLAAPALAQLVLPSYPGSDVAAVYQPSDVPAFINGLRYSRGPPFFTL